VWARHADAQLVVCHVVADATLSNPLFPQRSEADAVGFVELAGRAIDLIHQRVEQLTGRTDDSYRVLIASGESAAALLHEAEDVGASLIVVGSRGLSGIERLLLGDVASKVVRYARVPVLVVRPVSSSGLVLAATDLSDPAMPAVSEAARIARVRGLRLGLVHCIEVSPDPVVALAGPFGGGWSAPPAAAVEAARLAAENVLRETAARLNVNADVFAVTGNAAQAIIELAEAHRAELLVVGTHGRTAIRRLLLGSVAEKVVAGAPCSVLVVRME
jgi:nucleotide-binding universal stress UspA family protein